MTTHERHPARGSIRNRSGLGGGGAISNAPAPARATSGAKSARPSKSERERDLNESIAGAVRHGYEVIEQNIEQGRRAAEQFRQGELSAKEATKNGREMMRRAFSLSRETAIAWFDIVDRLLDPSPRRTTESESGATDSHWPPLYGHPPAFHGAPERMTLNPAPKLIPKAEPQERAAVIHARLWKTVHPLIPNKQLRLTDQLELRDAHGQPFAKSAPITATFRVSRDRDTVIVSARVSPTAAAGTHRTTIWQMNPAAGERAQIGELFIEVKE